MVHPSLLLIVLVLLTSLYGASSEGVPNSNADNNNPEPTSDSSEKKEFTLVIGKAFKWDRNPPTWTSMFLASNDHLPHYSAICAHLEALIETIANNNNNTEIELISIVGGLGFLPILECATFSRVTLFDGNVNEFTKVFEFIRHLKNYPTNYEAVDFAATFEEELKNEPEKWYLPAPLLKTDDANPRKLKIEQSKEFAFEYEGQAAPLTSMLSPSHYKELAWHPSSPAAYQRVRTALIQNLNERLYLKPPDDVDAKGRVCVFFVSMPGTEPLLKTIIEQTKNCAMVVPIRACNYYTGYCEPGFYEANAAQNRAHPAWELRALEALGKNYAKANSLHVWAPEDSELLGSVYDQKFAVSSTAADIVQNGALNRSENAAALQPIEGLLMHIFFGKIGGGCTQEKLNARHALFLDVLKTAVTDLPNLKRIVVADFNSELCAENNNNSDGNDNPMVFPSCGCIPDVSQLIGIVSSVIPKKEADAVVITYAPGAGNAKRNVFITFEL
jgi:hypothetical protein